MLFCDRPFVVGDLNVHFDKPDPTTSALNAVLDNLSLHQLSIGAATLKTG